jgi:glycosyltransferase involved in cell wall biosynthesis
VVTDETTGLLVLPGEPRALAKAIDRVLGSPALARRLAEAARRQAKDYDWEVLAGRVLDVYRGVNSIGYRPRAR